MNKYLLKNNCISIGFNPINGQDFFDLLSEYYYWIHSYYFSLTRHFYECIEYQQDQLIDQILNLEKYNIPGNLIFNSRLDNNNDFEKIIPKIIDKINLSGVTFLNPELCERCKKLYPDIETHISIRYIDYMYQEKNIPPINSLKYLIDRGIIKYIDVINISGSYSYSDKEFSRICHEYGVKTKFLLREGCMVGKAFNYCKFPGMEHTSNACKDHSKESFNVEDIKFSGRCHDCYQLKRELEYITSVNPTMYINDHKIENYNAFIEFCTYKNNNCIADCSKCRKCESFYKKIFNK